MLLNLKPVDHIAIMKKSWKLMEKILSGEKTLEERWYKFKRAPWDKIKIGDNIYFKDSGEPVTIKAKVTKVLQFADLTPKKTREIIIKYGKADLGTDDEMPSEIKEYISNKNYCIIIFFDNVKKIKPFNIDKTGFGAMSAWLTIDNVEKIKK